MLRMLRTYSHLKAMSSMATYFLLIMIQVAEETSPADMVLCEDLIRVEMDKLAVMPELEGMDKLFWAELDELEETSWSLCTTTASSLWQESSDQKQPAAKPLVNDNLVSLVLYHIILHCKSCFNSNLLFPSSVLSFLKNLKYLCSSTRFCI